MSGSSSLGSAALGAADTLGGGVPSWVVTIGSDIVGLFGGGSSYNQTHAQIQQWVSTIASDPNLATVAAQQAMENLRCWAGDQSVITPQNTARLFGSGSVAQGCGCEIEHGCRSDAQQALTAIATNLTTATRAGQTAANGIAHATGVTVVATGPGATPPIPLPTTSTGWLSLAIVVLIGAAIARFLVKGR